MTISLEQAKRVQFILNSVDNLDQLIKEVNVEVGKNKEYLEISIRRIPYETNSIGTRPEISTLLSPFLFLQGLYFIRNAYYTELKTLGVDTDSN